MREIDLRILVVRGFWKTLFLLKLPECVGSVIVTLTIRTANHEDA
jgi:hypothetical protein